MRLRRAGFTLIELLVVLLLLAISAAAAVPVLVGRTADPDVAAATKVAALLEQARDLARESGTTSTFVLAPREARYWLVSRDSVITRALDISPAQRIVAADSERVSCRFLPTGAATPCAFAIRGVRDVIVDVDQWSGVVRVRSEGTR